MSEIMWLKSLEGLPGKVCGGVGLSELDYILYFFSLREQPTKEVKQQPKTLSFITKLTLNVVISAALLCGLSLYEHPSRPR